MKLYELTDEWRAIEAALEESGGVLTPELEEALDQVETDFAVKAERTLAVIREMEAEAEAAKAESDRLRDMAKARSNAADNLKEYLRVQMRAVGMESIKTPIGKASRVQNSRPSIRWSGEVEDLPAPFQRHIPAQVKLDGTAAWEAWKEDPEALPEGFVVELGEHLRLT